MLLKKANNEACFLKAGFFGFEGSGKTFSATLLCIGLHQYIKSKKPIAIYDSETGYDYVKHLFDYAKIETLVVKSRSLKDLGQAIEEAKENCDILMADSVTHPYKELLSSYIRTRKGGYKFIAMQDWQPIKDTWNQQFAEPYVNSPLHFIWCARAKNIFEELIDEVESEKRGQIITKTIQTGTGSRSETESSFEPSLLVEFSREHNDPDSIKKNGLYQRRATIVKERFGILDGETTFFATPKKEKKIDYEELIGNNAVFNFFLPHIERLNIGGKHVGFNESSSDDLFKDENRNGIIQIKKRVKIALENIENGLITLFPASQGKDRANKILFLDEIAGTKSWAEISNQHPNDLEYYVRIINRFSDKVKKGEMFNGEAELRSLIQKCQKELKS